MQKKAIIFTLLLTTLLFVGCGAKTTPNPNNQTTDTNNTTNTTPIIDRNTTSDPSSPTNTMVVHDNTNHTESNRDIMLTEQDAKQIALQKVPGATENDLKKFKRDTDDTVVEYEVEIHYDGMEYEFKIHAYDGTVLEWDEEPLRETAR